MKSKHGNCNKPDKNRYEKFYALRTLTAGIQVFAVADTLKMGLFNVVKFLATV